MIGIILIAHAKMASETKTAVEYILKEQPCFSAVDVVDSDDASKAEQQFCQCLDAMAQHCDGVLVMADIFGATPCNIAMKNIVALADASHIEMVAGFNLPSVIKVMLERAQMDVASLARASLDAGQKYMRLGSQEAVVQQCFEQSKAA
jgi:mannose/fructose-specific phosphotransferase system component IIA